MSAAFPVAVFMALAASVTTTPSAHQPARIYVVVSDDRGQAVRGLTAADFFVHLDGKPVEIVSAGPATEPASVVLLTDRLAQTGDYRPDDLRAALRAFVRGVRAGNEASHFALTTFDQLITQVVKFPGSASEVDRAIGRLVGTALDAPLVDALEDACATSLRAPTDRRVIFLVYGAYRPDRGNTRVDLTADRCRASAASLWVIEARATDGRNYPNAARERIVEDTSRLSGGMREYALTARALEGLATLMAGLVASQYAIDFASGPVTPDSRLTVGVRRTGVFVMAPTWRPDPGIAR